MDDDTAALLAELTADDPVDLSFAFLTAVAASLPVVGGAASVVVDQVRRRQNTRMAEFMVELAAGYRELGDRLDRDYVRTAEFVDRLAVVIEESARARNQAKRQAYLGVGLATGTPTRPDVDEFALMIATLDRLEAVHLRVLGRLSEWENLADANGMWQALVRIEPELDDAVRLRIWDDLQGLALVEGRNLVTDDPLRSGPDISGPPGLLPLTPFGRRFLRFVIGPDGEMLGPHED